MAEYSQIINHLEANRVHIIHIFLTLTSLDCHFYTIRFVTSM